MARISSVPINRLNTLDVFVTAGVIEAIDAIFCPLCHIGLYINGFECELVISDKDGWHPAGFGGRVQVQPTVTWVATAILS